MRKVFAAISAALLTLHAHATDTTAGSLAADACMGEGVAQFGRYIGDWKIADEQLARDGSGWGPGQGARWTFKCVGDGTAIQDYWMPNGGGFGTNLRSWNPDTEAWEIVWAATGLNGLQHISAKLQDNGDIVMHIESPKPPQQRRIIFHPPDENGWTWAQQWSMDGGETWFDVYRITATPWTD